MEPGLPVRGGLGSKENRVIFVAEEWRSIKALPRQQRPGWFNLWEGCSL